MVKRVVEFDDADLASVMKARQSINHWFKKLKPPRSKRRSFQRKLNYCREIFEFDISSLYQGFDETPDYYVYLHCDPTCPISIGGKACLTFLATLGVKNAPFYVGKGREKRAWDLDRNGTHRKIRQRLVLSNKEIDVVILKEGLTESQALSYESKIIDICGVLGKGGILVNLDEGMRPEERRNLYGVLFEQFKQIKSY